MTSIKARIALFTFLIFATPLAARADYEQRLSLGVGVAHLSNPSTTSFTVGGDFERRLDMFLGLGVGMDYVFSNPSIFRLAVPTAYLHPFATEWFVSAAPLFQFQSGTSTHVGGRFGTRIPLPFGVFTLIPSVAVDVISGGPNYFFGLGIQI